MHHKFLPWCMSMAALQLHVRLLVLAVSSFGPSTHGHAGCKLSLTKLSITILSFFMQVGVLAPLVRLLHVGDAQTQRAAALLVGQFAAPPLEEGTLTVGLGERDGVGEEQQNSQGCDRLCLP